MLKRNEANAVLSKGTVVVEQYVLFSEYLERDVLVDCYLPSDMLLSESVNLLLINDGQDLITMDFAQILGDLVAENKIEPLMCVGIHCGTERRMEYGVAYSADYKGLGAKAGRYNKFIFDELMPFVRKTYKMPSFKEKAFAGFSLGGLTALDIVWNHASEFSKVGIFSGSLWWRRVGYEDGYDDEKDRIMHLQVQKGHFHPWLKFYFECGTKDETADRNNNGIIDSIDDTLDLIVALKSKGYTDAHIKFIELSDGRHDVETWGKAFPDFLIWGWGTK